MVGMLFVWRTLCRETAPATPDAANAKRNEDSIIGTAKREVRTHWFIIFMRSSFKWKYGIEFEPGMATFVWL
jgi:hypothetical protein